MQSDHNPTVCKSCGVERDGAASAWVINRRRQGPKIICAHCYIALASFDLRLDADLELSLSTESNASNQPLAATDDLFAQWLPHHDPARCGIESCLLCEARSADVSAEACRSWLEGRGLGGLFTLLRRDPGVEAVRSLIAAGADPRALDRRGKGVLCTAFAHGVAPEVLGALIDAGALVSMDAVDALAFPVLRHQPIEVGRHLKLYGLDPKRYDLGEHASEAWWQRRLRLLELLNERGIEPSPARVPTYPTLLQRAVDDRRVEAVDLLLRWPVDEKSQRDVLVAAVRSVKSSPRKAVATALDILSRLLEGGVDVDANSSRTSSVLDEVIRSEPGPRTRDMLLIFVRAGVDFTRPISHGFDAVTWACAWRRVDLAQMLGKPGGAALCMACDPRLLVPGRLETAAWVLQHDVDLELRHRYFFHRTPLLLAIRAADPALVRLLLDHGADTSVADDDGTTAAALLERAEWFPG